MDLRAFYQETGGNYEAAIKRFRDQERLKKYLGRFAEDSSFETAQAALREGNLTEAFRAVHSLKGICMNLYLDGLFRHVSALTELLRPYSAEDEASGSGRELPPEILEKSGITEAALDEVRKKVRELWD